MRVRFWGTRGSIPRPTLEMLRYGGNTSCTEVRLNDGMLVILDCGTGAYSLGQRLLEEGSKPTRGHIFISHTHWDHIQGFPFFAPLFIPGNEWDIYGPGQRNQLEATLAGQMEYNYFPITLGQLAAKVHYHDLKEETFIIGNMRIVTTYLNHPSLALGYRLEADNAVLAYIVDHEPHVAHQLVEGNPTDVALETLLIHAEERRHFEFLSGADLVIHDAQYTLAEYPAKTGWGHSPIEYAVAVAMGAKAKRLALYHHDPQRTDEQLDQLIKRLRSRAGGTGTLEVFGAAEGQVIELTTGVESTPAFTATTPAMSFTANVAVTAEKTILIVDDDPQIVRVLTLVLESEGFKLLTANDGVTALEIAERERPDLVISDWQMPGLTGIELSQSLRRSADSKVRDVPLILLTALAGSESTSLGFAAGVSDYLTKPFTPAHVRARVHTWLARSAAQPEGTVRDAD